ncbi:MAG: orotidine-5'-phosphate decarboxylase [Candidatus Marinarcus sp.]|uniref:orotidine-5'-phosphate decarboxylase n=1 Tax=Candidatus Marinarcus sp. TaxID=3100987 RepID=UPI003B005898
MKLCVALDLPSAKENLELVEKIKEYDVWLKVGLRAFIRDGYNFLGELKKINPNFKIFLDLKLHDIPNTMADAAQEIAQFGVDMFNVHASAGKVAMRTVMKRLESCQKQPIVLAVTALTSFDEANFQAVYNQDIASKATQFAKDAYESGIHGVVCSAFESQEIKNNTCADFVTLCPGIRPFGEDSGDQKRVATIPFAQENSVDFIVVGRPIYESTEPANIVKRILDIL